MQIYCDMDGVLADFDTGYELAFGTRPCKEADNVDWELVRKTEGFYAGLPLMPDALELWAFLLPHDPIILTGVPSSVEEAPQNKREWAWKNLGEGTKIRTCPSKYKNTFCKPGDVLIDDWEKYRSRWINMGGIWITHTSAASSIAALRELGF
jgi:hypothetical protein